jgi:hypothetical protein
LLTVCKSGLKAKEPIPFSLPMEALERAGNVKVSTGNLLLNVQWFRTLREAKVL